MASQPNITDRSKLRMERLRLEELEQQRWEQEALVMPEALNQALLMSFASVKTEFSDLDGLSWPRYPVPIVPNPWVIDDAPPPPTPKPAYPELSEIPDESEYVHRPQTPSPYSISSCAGLASFAPAEISRASRPTSKTSRSPLQPANQFTGMHSPDSNTLRCSEHTRATSCSQTNIFHMPTHCGANDTRYTLRQRSSFDASMQTLLSISTKHRHSNPQQ